MFVKYLAKGKLEEELLVILALSGTFTGEDIFLAVDARLHIMDYHGSVLLAFVLMGQGLGLGLW